MLCCLPLADEASHLFTIGNLRLRERPSEWERVTAEIGVPRGGVRLLRQVHGASVAVVRRGAQDTPHALEADIVISNDPCAAVAVQVADCAPILIADRRLGVVGAVHAGWRGAVQSAAVEGVHALGREFGSSPGDLVAAIGPCLGACCGEVGEEVVDAFRRAGHSEAALSRWFSPGPRGRPMLDLPAANADQLHAAGIPRAQIHAAGLCTRTHAGLLHSYRADGVRAGRMAGIIRARGGAPRTVD